MKAEFGEQGMKSCWDIKGCPASHYIGCPAYEKQTNCWDIKEGCLCSMHEDCEECPIHAEHKQDADKSESVD